MGAKVECPTRVRGLVHKEALSSVPSELLAVSAEQCSMWAAECASEKSCVPTERCKCWRVAVWNNSMECHSILVLYAVTLYCHCIRLLLRYPGGGGAFGGLSNTVQNIQANGVVKGPWMYYFWFSLSPLIMLHVATLLLSTFEDPKTSRVKEPPYSLVLLETPIWRGLHSLSQVGGWLAQTPPSCVLWWTASASRCAVRVHAGPRYVVFVTVKEEVRSGRGGGKDAR